MDNRSTPSKLVAAICLSGSVLFGLAGGAHANVSMAQREACTPDALRLCSSSIPDVAKVKACMLDNMANLSPGCRAAFPQNHAERSATPHAVPGHRVATTSKRGTTHAEARSHRGYRNGNEVAVANPARAHRHFHGLGNAFGPDDLMGMMRGGGGQISPDEAMGMARQILTTYRAACGSRAIPADYCGF